MSHAERRYGSRSIEMSGLTIRYSMPEEPWRGSECEAQRHEVRHHVRKVPNVVIVTVAKRLEPPTLAERFDELFTVQLTPERTFSVSPAT